MADERKVPQIDTINVITSFKSSEDSNNIIRPSTLLGRQRTFLEEIGRNLDVTEDAERKFKFSSTDLGGNNNSSNNNNNNHVSGEKIRVNAQGVPASSMFLAQQMRSQSQQQPQDPQDGDVSRENSAQQTLPHESSSQLSRVNSSRDLSSELEELFEEMRRIVGFERLKDSDKDPSEEGNNAQLIGGGQVGKEVVRHELRLLIKRLKKISPFENEAEMRAIERRLIARQEENTKLRNQLKESEYVRKRKEEVDAKIILDFQAQNRRLKHDLQRYRKARRDVMVDNDKLKEELEKAISFSETNAEELKDALAKLEEAREKIHKLEEENDEFGRKSASGNDLFVRKYEEQLVELKELRHENDKLTRQYETEKRLANDMKRQLTNIDGVKKRLEATVKDLRSELVEEHHRSVNAGIEAKQVKEKFEDLKVEFIEVKTLSAEQQKQMQERIREMYELQESLLNEIKNLQVTQSNSIVKSLAQKTVRLRSIANIIFKRKGAEEEFLAAANSSFSVGDDDTSAANNMTYNIAAELKDSPKRPATNGALDDEFLSIPSRATTISVSGSTVTKEPSDRAKLKAQAKINKKVTPYEQSLEMTNQQANKDIEEMQAALALREQTIEKLEARLSNVYKVLGETERKLEDARQNRVKEARNFSTPELNNAQDEIERVQKQYKKQSLFSS